MTDLNPYAPPSAAEPIEALSSRKPSRILIIPFAIFIIGGLVVVIPNVLLAILRPFGFDGDPVTIPEMFGRAILIFGGACWMRSAVHWRRASWLRAVVFSVLGCFCVAGANFLMQSDLWKAYQ